MLGLLIPFSRLVAIYSFIEVFRHQTSYNRFWDDRNCLTINLTSIRNLIRSFLTCSAIIPKSSQHTSDIAETELIFRVLIAMLYATKNHLRAAWGPEIIAGKAINPNTGSSTLVRVW